MNLSKLLKAARNVMTPCTVKLQCAIDQHERVVDDAIHGMALSTGKMIRALHPHSKFEHVKDNRNVGRNPW